MPDVALARQFIVVGPRYRDGDAERFLWRASLALAIHHEVKPVGNAEEFAAAAFARNASVRVMAERAAPRKNVDAIMKPVDLHDPRLLVAAVTSGGWGSDELSIGVQAPGKRLGATPKPSIVPVGAVAQGASYFEQVVVAPLVDDWPDKWPDKAKPQIMLPACALAQGRIGLLVDCPTNPAKDTIAWLVGVDGSTAGSEWRKAFGGGIAVRCEKTGVLWRWKIELAPQGIEFDARLPDPFGGADVVARLRLEADPAGGLRLVLAAEPATVGWRAKLDALAAATRAAGTPLVVDVAPGITPFVWPVAVTTAGRFEIKTPSDPRIERGSLRASLVGPPSRGGTLPSVCDLVAPQGQLLAARIKPEQPLRLEVRAGKTEPAPSFCRVGVSWVASDRTMTTSIGLWPKKNDGKPQDQPFEIDTAALRADLDARYGAAGIGPRPDAPASAYLALERGVVQVPIPPIPPPDTTDEGASAAPSRSSFVGFLSIDLSDADRGASGVTLVVDDSERTVAMLAFEAQAVSSVDVELAGASATLDGVVWLADALPSPDEVVPTLAAGPIAARSLPVKLIAAAPDSPLCGTFSPIEAGTMPATVTLDWRASKGGGEIIHWTSISDMPLVSGTAMTRSRDNATEPSRSRDLVPVRYRVEPGKVGRITLSAAVKTPLPTAAVAGAVSTTFGWPQLVDVDPLGVTMVPLTLPGIEIRPDKTNTNAVTLMARLRYDLPVLGELFANATPPKGSGEADEATARPAPTSLDMVALEGIWSDQARKLALTRTQDDRLAGDWSAPGPVAGVKVDTLARPWTWTAKFGWQVAAPTVNAPLGVYTLRDEVAWTGGEAALAGESFDLSIGGTNGGKVPDKKLTVRGFALERYRYDAPPHLVDTRGFAMAAAAVQPPPAPRSFVARSIGRLTSPDTFEAGRLATTPQPIKLVLPDNTDWAQLSFRDLPLDAAGGFVAAGTPEAALGPETTAFDRDRTRDAGYEWRLHRPAPVPCPPGREKSRPLPWDIPIGPFFARPLRLWSLSTGNGTVTAVTVIAGIDWRRSRTDEKVPFGDDAPYATGNPVALVFDGSNGPLTLKTVQSVEVGEGNLQIKPDAFARLDFALACLSAHRAPRVGERIAARLGLQMSVVAGKLVLDNGTLACRLFGTDRAFTNGTLEAGQKAASSVVFKAADVADFVGLRLKRVAVCLDPESGLPTLELAGTARVIGKGLGERALTVAALKLDGTLSWLGATTEPGGGRAITIDHDVGTLCGDFISSRKTAKAPIRGFPAEGTIEGRVAMAFDLLKPADPFAVPATVQHLSIVWNEGGSFRCRHRFSRIERVKGQPEFPSSLRVSIDKPGGATARESTIRWPVKTVEGVAALGQSALGIDGTKNADFAVEVDVKPDVAPLVHRVAPAFRDIDLPLTVLTTGGDAAPPVVGLPWRFRVRVEHALLRDNTPILSWIGIDDVEIVDITEPADTETYAAMARYRKAAAGHVAGDTEMPAPGIVMVGLIPRVFRQVLQAQASLAVFGGGVFEWQLHDGRRLVAPLPWLLTVKDGAVVPLPEPITQAPSSVQKVTVASADLVAAIPLRDGGGRTTTLDVGDGGAFDVATSLEAMFGKRALDPIRAVDRAFAGADKDAAQDKADPKLTHRLSRPIFWRALLVLARGAVLTGVDGTSIPPPRILALLPGGRAGDVARLEIGTMRPRRADTEPPSHALVVIERRALSVLPVDQTGTPTAERRLGLARSVLARTRDALLAWLVRFNDDADGEFPTIAGMDPILLPPAKLAPLLVAAPRSIAKTVHASARLGWPSPLTYRPGPDLGPNRPIQDEVHAWAGRVAAFGLERIAYGKSEEPRFLAFGHRILFDRAPLSIVSPPDRALQPAPPRARVPGDRAIGKAIDGAGGSGKDAAPVSPGLLEAATIGGRAGVMALDHVGLVVGQTSASEFDPDNPRFGRPADRGSLVWGADRSPRSTGLPEVRQIERRRRTYVDENILNEIAPVASVKARRALSELLVLDGCGSIVRFPPKKVADTDTPNSASIVIRVDAPAGGLLASDTNGSIRLAITLPNLEKVHVLSVLRGLGWVPPVNGNGAELRASLSVGDAVVTFRAAVLDKGVGADRAVLTLLPAAAGEAPPTRQLDLLRAAIRLATPETRAILTMTWPGALSAGQAAVPADAISYTLTTTPTQALEPGPPRSLDIPLAIRPGNRPTLAIPLATAIFADPSYDRELSGAATTTRAPTVTGGGTLLISVDRPEYDPAETIHFAFGELDPAFDQPLRDAKVRPFITSAEAWTIAMTLLPRSLSDGTTPPARKLVIRGVNAGTGGHKAIPGKAYAVALAALARADGSPLTLEAGDRVVWTATPPAVVGNAVSVSFGIVAQPVISPPNAVYGLVTLAARATPDLFASAPLPTRIEFPDADQLLTDLARGYVRRRAVFIWRFAPRPTGGAALKAALVKLDGAGGGQITDGKKGVVGMSG